MGPAQDQVFGTTELVIHILRRVHGGTSYISGYNKSNLLRLWHARRVSRLFYDCVLETFMQKHIRWTSVILELGQFTTDLNSSDNAEWRRIGDTSVHNCFGVDDDHGESELDYVYGDHITGRVTVEYFFREWEAEATDMNGCPIGPKKRAIFSPKLGKLPYDADLCNERIKELIEKKRLFPHSCVILWDIAHDMELPELHLVSEDGKVSFNWYAMLRDFFCLEREVRHLKTRKVQQPYRICFHIVGASPKFGNEETSSVIGDQTVQNIHIHIYHITYATRN